ncbi:hypothetical protein K3495_g1218 [Podosphaera aphanis]|nr:hypothetical protein K3495_g1218 [Podosphaera aphanis]
MRILGLIRRARHLGTISVWSTVYRLIYPRQPQLKKHIKIDDEERQRPSHVEDNYPGARLLLCSKMSMLLLFSLGMLFLLLLFLGYVVYRPPQILIAYFQWRFPQVVFHLPLPLASKVVALTLDDAPSSATAEILDLLNTYDAKATFFIIGNQISAYPHLVQRIHDEGHEIGIHGWADEPAYKLPLIELKSQIQKMEMMLPLNVDGSKWFRPGSGWFNKPMIELLETIGYRIALGSIYPHDPQIPYPKINAAHVLSKTYPGGVIIMHDRRSYSVEQLRLILMGLTTTGWQVRTLSQLQQIKIQ